MARFEKLDEKNFFLPFEDLKNRSILLKVGFDFIEIPGIVLFVNSRTSMQQFLNPSIPIIKVTKELLQEYKLQLAEESDNYIISESRLLPKTKDHLNLDNLKKVASFIRIEKGSITINNMVISYVGAECAGSTIAGRESLYISKDDFYKVKLEIEKFVKI